jgi:hypothetical protein
MRLPVVSFGGYGSFHEIDLLPEQIKLQILQYYPYTSYIRIGPIIYNNGNDMSEWWIGGWKDISSPNCDCEWSRIMYLNKI